jgi:GT2 family glycosyltransferase
MIPGDEAGAILAAPLRGVAWDGRVLAFAGDESAHGAVLALDLDGCHFADGRICDARLSFDLPYSPSGCETLDAMPRLGRGGPALAPRALRLRMGAAGIEPVAVAPAPGLRPLGPSRCLPFGSDLSTHAVTVVVPIYDAPADVARCLEALLAHTPASVPLLLIDDASPHPAIAPLLAARATAPRIRVLRNARNLGFTATANRGLRAAGRNDVVLLNADTEVGPHWLTGLRRAAYADPHIGSATAVSDNAGAFSVPELETANPLPRGWSACDTARALWQDAGLAYPELPTGNGFCLYLRRDLLDETGDFDEAAFPRGYGEENDLCQRGSACGWRHVIAGNVFVAHARSRSFGDAERVALGIAGMAVLRQRYPSYEADVAATLHAFERQVLDWRVRVIHARAAAGTAAPSPRILCIDATDPREAPASWRLVRDARELRLHPAAATGAPAPPCARAAVADDAATARVIWDWLQRHAIEAVCTGDADPLGVAPLARALEIPLLPGGARARIGEARP